MTVIITPLGGFGEVGRNCVAIEINKQILIIDLGFNLEKLLEYESKFSYRHKPGINYMIKKEILPALNKLKYKRKDIIGLICSHAHLDHIGAIPYLGKKLPCKIYATPFTSEVIKSLCDKRFDYSKIQNIQPNTTINVSGINIDIIPISHSTPQSVIIAVHSPIGIIMYANDFKLQSGFLKESQTDMKLFKKYKGKVKLLFLDSLYSSQDGENESENKVIEEFNKLNLDNKRTIIVSTFSSHIERLITIAKYGKKLGKKIVFLGSALSKYISAAKNTDIYDLSQYGEIIKGKRNINMFFRKLANPKDYFLIVTGHQGEPNAVLSKMINGLFKFTNEDVVIFSNTVIPADVCIENRKLLEEQLNDRKVEIIKDLHVSGHLFSSDHKRFVKIIEPEIIIPSHGTPDMMKSMENLFKEGEFSKIKVILLKNGEKLTF